MKRTPGRPPLDDHDASVPVHLTVTARTYDELYRQARADRVSVPEQIRRALHQTVILPGLKTRK
jgi:CxxC motif-containing protein (DUF1111 family)